MSTLRPWRVLDSERSNLVKTIRTEFLALIDDPATNEQDCLRFLRDHAGLFFADPPFRLFAVAELRLGADHRVDFCVVEEGFSAGTRYTLVEVESPNARLYKVSDGRTSARLATALDQIAEWRRWIAADRPEAQRLFPSWGWQGRGEPVFRYQIVAGRRPETEQAADKLQTHERNGVEVMSFDRLADVCGGRHFPSLLSDTVSAQAGEYRNNRELRNRAVNPFAVALSDAEWRQVTTQAGLDMQMHIIPAFLDGIVPRLRSNEGRLAAFDAELAALDPAVRQLYEGRA